MTATLEPAEVLVPVDEIRRRLGLPRGEAARQLREHAAAHNLTLDVHDDWAGQPAVPQAQARALVDAVTDARELALQAKRARNREGEVRALAAEQRCQQRADLCYELALSEFGDPGIALQLAAQAASQAVPDGALTRQLDAIAVRWQQGFRTLAPEPVRGDRDDDFPADLDEFHGREWLRQSLNDTVYKPIPPAASKRLREIIRGRAR